MERSEGARSFPRPAPRGLRVLIPKLFRVSDTDFSEFRRQHFSAFRRQNCTCPAPELPALTCSFVKLLFDRQQLQQSARMKNTINKAYGNTICACFCIYLRRWRAHLPHDVCASGVVGAAEVARGRVHHHVCSEILRAMAAMILTIA